MLTQQNVADSAGISRVHYATIEQGKRNPSVNVAINIANILGFDWTNFFTMDCSESEQKGEKVQ